MTAPHPISVIANLRLLLTSPPWFVALHPWR
jgi:hypothetical protein